MAKRKTAALAVIEPVAAAGTALVPVAAKPASVPVPVNPDIDPDPRNPHSLLPLIGDPPGCEDTRIMHGTLRCVYRGHRNSADTFATVKLRVADSADPLAVTALRHEVLAPVGADDLYADPWLFGRLIDHAMGRETADATALLCYVTVTDPDGRLHEQWRRGRAMTERLVDRFHTPALLVQHAPAHKQRATRPHLHLLMAVRVLGPRGYGAPIAALIGDKARDLFVDAWHEAG